MTKEKEDKVFMKLLADESAKLRKKLKELKMEEKCPLFLNQCEYVKCTLTEREKADCCPKNKRRE